MEMRLTTTAIKATIHGSQFRIIPLGETIEVATRLGDTVRVFWKQHEDGKIGLTITAEDLEMGTTCMP